MEETNQEYYNSIVTKKIAKRIIQLRDEEEYSWRALCNKINEEFPGIVKNPGHQLDGMYLEYSARELLNNK